MFNHIALPPYKALKQLLKAKAAEINFDHYACTHLNARRLIKQFLEQTNGPSGIIIEGMPGLGKSTLAEHFLKNRSYQFLKALSKDEAEVQLNECFHQGQIIIIDELNTLPYLEYSLNAFMMGQDLNGNAARRPGFKVIATQNPIHFSGRYALSPALENRFLKIEVKEYTHQDLVNIAKVKGIAPQLVEKYVNDFLIAKKHAETHRLKPTPTARDFINELNIFFKPSAATGSGSKRNRDTNEFYQDDGADSAKKNRSNDREL